METSLIQPEKCAVPEMESEIKKADRNIQIVQESSNRMENSLAEPEKCATPEIKSENNCEIKNADKPESEPMQSGHGMQAGHFSSEIFKIEIGNIPKVINYGEIKKLINKKYNLKAHKIKYLKNIRKAYITFTGEGDRRKVINH